MKIFIASDLHGEIRPHGYDVPEGLDFDVAVFAGDIGDGPEAVEWLLGQRALRDRPVLFVAGNHEYYNSILQDQASLIRDAARGTHITFLDGDEVPVIDGVRFLGCTLWTDYRFEARDQIIGLRSGMSVNDHRAILTSDGAEYPTPLVPSAAYRRHLIERRWLIDRLAEGHDGQTVVVTHHGVHPGSLHPRYAGDGAINASFISDLSDVIAEHQPALWIHGHVHDTHDYTVGETTRIVCNPRGYSRGGRIENERFIPDLVVELPEWIPKPPWQQ
ncbi:metallophosphoesterase family protein [Bradyrhizobium manausense]|uniref:metallophosphoesterase n=1 Tax=Bradyrhizobium TaxID=374 RepID=UPI001BAA67A3|nr:MULTISPECIES: metallophosphoesterase [Bradyrhizobium]MBR0825713.1 metallophosphoesterase family protein [Bradyrhizobium manausense]UVO31340.1 metallophosphoesterase family protein [Bradyrhizobium arachidis]